MIRQPAVAGQFYTDDPDKLRTQLKAMIAPAPFKERALGVISPHAGYMYSGAVAGKLFGEVAVPSTVVILGPNHHGIGARAAIFPEGSWQTPLGTAPVNSSLATLIKKHSSIVEADQKAHIFEHSLEVQLPFLQFLRPDVSIVPVCLGFRDFKSCLLLGSGIASAIRDYGDEVLIVASSDMTHYETAASAKQKDEQAINMVLALDAEGLLLVCAQKDITMCGVVPATVMLVAAKGLGATKARLVQYATSGDVTGDNRQVVAYAALTVQ
ncbi:MEMO-like protein [Geotalea daltonii FRC-32]|uniref:MEMO1 family protein Geob_3013 n=1 Tax=Geotalea daltonii (strain DSM 22248 / JCM 15807 / FRC-32) TaxID=316067 RepID=B9M310_GEODF|nr:AmmeMemoRadiSam system protein B [Geotalea daltonii]ACM21356.1 MEMO-like protein [Geotalea daltonii FRC-32]